MKKNQRDHFPPGKRRKYVFCLMLSVVVLLTSLGASIASPAYAQQKKLDVSYDKVSLSAVLDDLKTKTGYHFFYFEESLPSSITVSLSRNGITLEQLLGEILPCNGFTYNISENLVSISPAQNKVQQEPTQITVKGMVKDSEGKPISGVSVMIKGTGKGTQTDLNGKFSLTIPDPATARLIFSYLGKKSIEIAYKGQPELNVSLEDDILSIGEVVVTGIFNKPKESYTGAATMITNEQLRSSSSQGLISSIGNVEPTFKVVRSNLYGSDPNRIASNQITMRGPTTIADYQADLESAIKANLPLFIIDRFEASLEEFVALNEDRIENVVILKDASATALYGSKASNGVIVVTTKQPEKGKLRVIYNGNFAFKAPDLSSYNLMNAREKLQYELDAGLYSMSTPDRQQDEMLKYYRRKLDVERGVDTDWLHYPIRLGIINSHSLSMEGGEGAARYSVNVSNNNEQGVMKGSSRNTFSGDMYLHYGIKNFAFSNRLKITNVYAPNSNYGSFSEYTRKNAYWKPYDDNGDLIKILDSYYYDSLGTSAGAAGNSEVVKENSRNPLWNATLPGIDEEKYTRIKNDFQAEWFINEDLTLRGGLSLAYLNGRKDVFKSPDHTDFSAYSGSDLNRRGSYYLKMKEEFDCTGSLTLSYNHVFNTKHALNAGLNGEIYMGRNEWYSLLAEGILVNDFDFLAAASQYEQDGKPLGDEGLVHRLSLRSFVNYMYDARYFVDASLAVDGSSQFGSNKQFAPFFSLGAGWNIHNEQFMSGQHVLNQAILRGSYGVTGSVNFSPYDSHRMYDMYKSANYRGSTGMILKSLGNPDLGWQMTDSYNIGLNLGFLDNRFTLNLDLYERITKDLVASVNIPTSSGLSQYQANIGKVSNRGFEIDLGVRIIDNRENNLRWTVTGSVRQNKNKILEIGEYLDSFNAEKLADESAKRNPVFLFKEGESMNTIFAVRSKGIDPSTGKEIFIKLDGTETFTWSTDDYAACGVAEPIAWGTINSSLRWKGFILDLYFNYTTGGYQYNHTLANKIENIYPYMNADRRATTQRWKNPGDITFFKSITEFNKTDMTSRFIMKENTFQLSTVSLRYMVPTLWSKRNLGVSSMEVRGSVEDVFYISSIERERGTEYPFTNFFSFGLKLTF